MSDVIIDTRPEETLESLDADLIINIDLYDDGYSVAYNYKVDGKGTHVPYNCWFQFTREQMVQKHVQVIRDVKPRTAVIRTGAHSTGHIKDIALHPGVIKSIIEGKLDAADLTLHC